jgi:hypothetical protein
MFPYGDAQFQLDLHNQHASELRREAAARRLAKSAHGSGRLHLFKRRPRPVRAPMP